MLRLVLFNGINDVNTYALLMYVLYIIHILMVEPTYDIDMLCICII